MSLTIANPLPPNLGAVQVWMESLSDGQVTAWAAGIPDCKVTAESEAAALDALRIAITQRRLTIGLLPLPLFDTENPWVRFYGVLKDDPLFIEWSDRFWAEKQQINDDEELSVEELLSML
jgi:hypothetical protein